MTARWAAVVLAATVVVLAGCEATVGSELTVTGPDTLEAKVTVTLTGAAAQAFGDDPELLSRLENLIADRSGAPVDRRRSGDELSYTVDVPVDRITAASNLTGLGAVTASDDGSGRSAVTLSFVPPAELRAALEAGDDPDAAEQLLANTVVQTRLVADRVESVTGLQSSQDPVVTVTSDERSVTVSRPVSSTAAGELTAVASAGSAPPLGLLAVAAAAVIAFATLAVPRLVRRLPRD